MRLGEAPTIELTVTLIEHDWQCIVSNMLAHIERRPRIYGSAENIRRIVRVLNQLSLIDDTEVENDWTVEQLRELVATC